MSLLGKSLRPSMVMPHSAPSWWKASKRPYLYGPKLPQTMSALVVSDRRVVSAAIRGQEVFGVLVLGLVRFEAVSFFLLFLERLVVVVVLENGLVLESGTNFGCFAFFVHSVCFPDDAVDRIGALHARGLKVFASVRDFLLGIESAGKEIPNKEPYWVTSARCRAVGGELNPNPAE
jgi:hypothetical protein